MGYHRHATSGMGLELEDVLAHQRDIQPSYNEAFALQVAAYQVSEHADLLEQQITTQAEETGRLMNWGQWILVGLGALTAVVVAKKLLGRKGRR